MKIVHKFGVSILLLFTLMIIVVLTGSIEVSLEQIFSPALNPILSDLIFKIRLPRILIAIAAGGGLAVSGLLLQTWFKNQLADPFLLGIHSGSSLGVVLYVLGLSTFFSKIKFIEDSGMVLFGIVGALMTLLLMLIISAKFKGSIYIIIFGVVLSFFITGLINLILSFSSSEDLKHFFLWSLGSFDRISTNHSIIILLITVSLVIILYRSSRELNLCLLGEDYAKESGVDLSFLRKVLIPSIGIISGMISVYCGPVIFVGLMAPHLTRMIFLTSNHRILIPASFIVGAVLCLLVTFFSNGFFGGISIPVNALLGLIGTPFVLLLLIKNNSINSRGDHV